jgi:hypothetical protein
MSRKITHCYAQRGRRIGAIAVAATLLAAPAFANGGDFFAEFTANWNVTNTDAGPAYFGFIRDTKGKAIPNATVSATIQPIGSSMIVQSDVLGHYKIPGFAKTIDPKNVVIGCGMPGYKQVLADRRDRNRKPNQPIEVNCTLAPMAGSSS